MSLDPSIFPNNLPKTPQLVPVFVINVKSSGATPGVTNETIGRNIVYLGNGEIKTIENKFGYNLEVSEITGWDTLTETLAYKSINLDCHLYGKTPNGSQIHLSYGGVIKHSDKSGAVVGGDSKFSDFDDAYVTNTPSFEFGSGVEKEFEWVHEKALVGQGRFLKDKDGDICVQYIVYVVDF